MACSFEARLVTGSEADRGSLPRVAEAYEPARDLALPDVATLERLVTRLIEAGGHSSYGDVVTVLATTALRISEVSRLRVGDQPSGHRSGPDPDA